MNKASIIGSGIGGLAAAIRLRLKGYKVVVFEANSSFGGKAAEIKKKGFRFDKGPSLLTMPEKIDELFYLAKKNPKDYFNYSKLNESCRYFYEDGTSIVAHAKATDFAKEVYEKTRVSKRTIIEYIKHNTFVFNSTSHLFLEKSLHKLTSYLSLKVFYSFLKIPFLNLFSSMNKVNNKKFKNKKITQLFNRFATYNGSNPYLAPGVLNSISHLEFVRGVFYPKNGMRSISTSLFNLAQEIGVEFKFNTPIKKINVDKNKVVSILTEGKEFFSDIIVCNNDVYYVYKKLLPAKYSFKLNTEQERSSSAIIFYLGIKKEFQSLDLHNIFFSEDYKKEFESIQKGHIYKDPTIYINISSKKTYSDAPKNMENWFVMINTPFNSGQDWNKLLAEARANVINKLNRILKIDVESLIAYEESSDPRNIEAETHSFAGSLYGTSSNSKGAAFFRHPNFSRKIKGLYFCGGSVHPGGGVPLVLSSAKIVDGLIPAINEK